MTRTAVASLLLAALVTLDAAPALADVVTRDHRTQPAPAAPVATGSAQGSATIGVAVGPRRYRRRPGPRFMMPLKVDIGAIGSGSDRGGISGVEAKVGIHWASLSPQPTNFDVGLGVILAAMPGPDDNTANTTDDVVFGGAYVEIAQTLSHGDYWRTWAGGRGEYLATEAFGNDHTGLGVAGRLSAELYLSGVGIEPRGLFLGTYAIGVYAEAGARDLGPDVGGLQISGGLTFRTPLVFAP
ncbi:MAG: hypothetical protein KBG28_01400 [Kofleriaceae bacterium]|nr:hypothetical protein [Kofleriaceae bacterium]MBP9202608.1 hypothetical protein [Kofleriaceae bacterium]